MLRCCLGLALLLAAAAAAPVEEGKVRFDDFRVYRVLPTTQEQVDLLRGLEDSGDGVNFWTQPMQNVPVDVMVSPSRRSNILALTRSVGLNASVFIQDVQKLIDEENPNASFADEFGWTAYYPIADVYAWMDSLSGKYPGIVESLKIGESTEKQHIKGVIISYDKGKPIVFVESGIHAREWITVASTTYLINELLTSKDPKVRNVAENFQWHIVPSTNPDGYRYSHEYNRLWRKTRSEGEPCKGVDGNRNWPYQFNAESGSSTNTCSETYRGKNPFSEPETNALSRYLMAIKYDLLVYFCVHSYSQVLMIPYGFPVDWEDASWENVIENIGEEAVKVLEKVHGTSYGFGQIHNAIGYNASGGSMDWVKDFLQIKYTYEWELRDKGRYGFLLPANQIISTSDETVASMVYILERVQEEEAKDKDSGSDASGGVQ